MEDNHNHFALHAEPGVSKLLQKGQAILLEDEPGCLQKITIGLNWEGDVDLDLALFVFQDDGKHRDTITPTASPSSDGSIVHGGDADHCDSARDGEVAFIYVPKIEEHLHTIYCAAYTLGDGLAKKLGKLTMYVKDLTDDGLDHDAGWEAPNTEVTHIEMFGSKAPEGTSSAVVGKLVKEHDGHWFFVSIMDFHPFGLISQLGRECARIEHEGETPGQAMWRNTTEAAVEERKELLENGTLQRQGSRVSITSPRTKAMPKSLDEATQLLKQRDAYIDQQSKRTERLEMRVQELERMLQDKEMELAERNNQAKKKLRAQEAEYRRQRNEDLNSIEDRIIDLVEAKVQEKLEAIHANSVQRPRSTPPLRTSQSVYVRGQRDVSPRGLHHSYSGIDVAAPNEFARSPSHGSLQRQQSLHRQSSGSAFKRHYPDRDYYRR